MEKRVTHVLGRNVENFFKLLPPFEFAELDLGARALVVDGVEVVVLDQRRVKANVFLPLVKIIYPVIKADNFFHVRDPSLGMLNEFWDFSLHRWCSSRSSRVTSKTNTSFTNKKTRKIISLHSQTRKFFLFQGNRCGKFLQIGKMEINEKRDYFVSRKSRKRLPFSRI